MIYPTHPSLMQLQISITTTPQTWQVKAESAWVNHSDSPSESIHTVLQFNSREYFFLYNVPTTKFSRYLRGRSTLDDSSLWFLSLVGIVRYGLYARFRSWIYRTPLPPCFLVVLWYTAGNTRSMAPQYVWRELPPRVSILTRDLHLWIIYANWVRKFDKPPRL